MSEAAAAAPWCVFVDRDGVINRRVVGDYVRDWAQFAFLPGALEALAGLTRRAPYVVVVTNQQGVGKGLMSAAALEDIHGRLAESVVAANGRLDAILACTHLAEDGCGCRKPRDGLARAWLEQHRDVRLTDSFMVGDSPSDLIMGRSVGVGTCVGIGSGWATVQDEGPETAICDVQFTSLSHFYEWLGPPTSFGAPP